MTDTEERVESVERAEEEKMDLMEAYYLGTRTQYLASCKPARESITVVSEGGKGDLVSSLRFFIDRADILDASEHLVEDTREFVEHLVEEYDVGEPPTESDAQRAAEFSSRWAEAFSVMESEHSIVHTQDSGFFDVDRAMENPAEFFEPDVWDWLKEESKQDLREAIRTLAVDCPTASVMVSLRAVERQLREWHNERSSEEVDLGPWGHVLGELADLYDDHEKERPEVLTDLSYLKDRRNEVNHMETSPSSREAEINLRRVQATIENIYREIDR
jgi:hypothetical protein